MNSERGTLMTKNEELKQDIKLIVKETMTEALADMKRKGIVNEDKASPYQKTEQLLFNYVKFSAVIADKEKSILFIQEGGIQHRSKSITCAPVDGGNGDIKSASEKADDQIASLEHSIVVTRRCIKIIDDALKMIEDEPYFEILPMRYFEGRSREYIAEHFEVDVATISRNKNKLIDSLKIVLFSDEVILDMFR